MPRNDEPVEGQIEVPFTREELSVAHTECERIYNWLAEVVGTDEDLHGLDVALTILRKMIESMR